MPGSRKSSLTPTEKMRSSVAPTVKMSGSRKSSLTPSEKKASKTKSSMNLFKVDSENSLTVKKLSQLLKNLGIKSENSSKKSADSSFESLKKKGFKTKK